MPGRWCKRFRQLARIAAFSESRCRNGRNRRLLRLQIARVDSTPCKGLGSSGKIPLSVRHGNSSDTTVRQRAPPRRIYAAHRGRQYRRPQPHTDHDRLPRGCAALRQGAGRRADAAEGAASRDRRRRCRRHSAARCLRLVPAARPGHLRVDGSGAGGARAIRRDGRAARRQLRGGRGGSSLMARAGDAHRRELIVDYFGASSRLRTLRHTDAFGAAIFVVDFDRGPRHYRTLGSFGPNFGGAAPGEPQVTEQSSMDLLYQAQLVFHYERLMSLAFALCKHPVSSLLLGVGGAAMWRFLRAYLPECAPILVDNDEAVVAIARRWFYLSQSVIIDTAERFLAGTKDRYDVILVDLYNAQGPALFDERFWRRCMDALAPGGCMATNWADFAVNQAVRPMADAQQKLAQSRGLDTYFVTRRGFRDNLVQYLPTGPEREPEAITGALERFARARHLPDRGRGILEHCIIAPRFPIGG